MVGIKCELCGGKKVQRSVQVETCDTCINNGRHRLDHPCINCVHNKEAASYYIAAKY